MRRLPRTLAIYMAASVAYAIVVYVVISLLFTAELVVARLINVPGDPLQFVLSTADRHLISFLLYLAFSLIAALIAYRIATAVTAALGIEERRAAELALVSGLASQLSGKHSRQEIIRSSLGAIREALPKGMTVGFLELDDDAGAFCIPMEDGPASGELPTDRYPLETLPIEIRGQVITERLPLVLTQTDDDDRAWRALVARFPPLVSVRTFALLPLVSNTRLVGVLMLRHPEANMLAPSHLDLVALLAHTISGALENARSIAEAEARADREAVVNKVAKTVRASLDANEVLRRTGEEVGLALNVSRVVVATGATSDDLRVAYCWAAPGVTRFPIGSQRGRIARQAAAENRTIVVHDWELERADRQASPEERQRGGGEARASIAVPIAVAGQLVGALVATQVGRPRTWTGDEVHLLEAVGHELRAAMETARLFQARQRESERMLLLHHASAVLAGQTDPRVILDEILKNAVKLLGQGSASLFIWVPEAKVLRNVRDFNMKEKDATRILRVGQGAAGSAFERIAPVIVNDYQTWPGATKESIAAGLRAAIAVPLVRSGEPIGAIVVRSFDAVGRYTEEDGHLLTLFADQAVSALTAAEAFEQQRAAVGELEQLSMAKSDFISIVSHEFRTPLTGIQGFSEMMRDEDLTPAEIKEFASDINKDALRLNRMITDMLDLDRMESGRMLLHRGEVDINAIIREVAGRVRPNSPRHPIELDLDDRLPVFSGDLDKLTQVVTNLLSNAVKYSPKGGDIRIASHADAGSVEVTVTDHGLGIPAEALEKVFERYSRIESTATRHIQGTGLGLPIVRQIVEMHGGRAWVESEVGKGSVFHFKVPLAALTQAV
ncbi:MAG: GAF domain-containing protein [Chloroflexi bacterium]|nr:GAF domain-containing protein [Chloroflexota bacterium]